MDSHFPNSPPTPRRLLLQDPQWRSGHIELPTQLESSGTIRKQGWRQAGGPRQQACGRLYGARPRCTRARGAPRASGLAWSGLAAAGRKEVSAAARLLAGASTRRPCHRTRPPATRPRRPRTATPGRLVCSAPSAPGPPRAAQVQRPALSASARPPPTPTPTLRGSRGAPSFSKSRNITLWSHPAPRYLLAAPRPPPWLPGSPQAPRASGAHSCNPVPCVHHAAQARTFGVCTSGPGGASNFFLVTQKNSSTVIQSTPKIGSAKRRVRRRMVPFASSSPRRSAPGAPPSGQGRRGRSPGELQPRDPGAGAAGSC